MTTPNSDELLLQNALIGQQPQEQQQDPNALYADFMKEEKVTNVIAQINPDKLIVDIEHRLRGHRKDALSGQWIKSRGKREISEELISNFVSFLGAILTDNTTLSNYAPGEINNIMEMVIDYVKTDLTDNDEDYGIKGDFNEMTRIANIVCITVFSVLKRAMNGMEARRIFGALRVHETLTQSAPQKRFIDAFKFW